MPRTSPSELTISVTTRPQPPWRFTSRRKTVSVIPAIRATANGEGRTTRPIFTVLVEPSVRLDVGRIDFHRHTLPDELDGQHEARLLRVLANQPADDSTERTVNVLDHHPLADHRARVKL